MNVNTLNQTLYAGLLTDTVSCTHSFPHTVSHRYVDPTWQGLPHCAALWLCSDKHFIMKS